MLVYLYTHNTNQRVHLYSTSTLRVQSVWCLCWVDVMSCHVTAQATPSMNMRCLIMSEPHLQWIAVFAIREKMLAVCFQPWTICEARKRVHNLLMLHHNFPGAVKRAKLLVANTATSCTSSKEIEMKCPFGYQAYSEYFLYNGTLH